MQQIKKPGDTQVQIKKQQNLQWHMCGHANNKNKNYRNKLITDNDDDCLFTIGIWWV